MGFIYTKVKRALRARRGLRNCIMGLIIILLRTFCLCILLEQSPLGMEEAWSGYGGVVRMARPQTLPHAYIVRELCIYTCTIYTLGSSARVARAEAYGIILWY